MTKSAVAPRARASTVCSALGDSSALAAYNFGIGGRHFKKIEDLVPAPVARNDGRRDRADQGSRFMRMERVVEAVAAPDTDSVQPEEKNDAAALAQWLSQDIRGFNVFNYITLRAVLAAMTALIISFTVRAGVIRWLTTKKIGQAVRTDGPQTHLAKSGTPTMGGALILIAIGITTLLWGDLANRYVWVAADRYARFRRHRLVRRLEEGRLSRSERSGQPLEVLLAVGDRFGRRHLSGDVRDAAGAEWN